VTEHKSASAFDFESMRRAIEQLDADLLTSLYADNAKMHIVNRYSTPSSPRELHGKEEIAEHLKYVCGRAMTHHVENEVIGEDRVAFNEVCEYPDGTRVLAAMILEAVMDSGRAR
jgi:hypothetical protein